MTEKQMEAAINRILDRLDVINLLYITKIAETIQKIGELNQSSINRMLIMADMGADIAEINNKLRTATKLNTADLFAVYNQSLNDIYTDKRFAAYLQTNPLPQPRRERVSRFAQLISVQTAERMVNISNTTSISETYRQAVDKSILAVSSGVENYKEATRQTVRELGTNGMQVQYESGYHRRLDTAVRQNIIDGSNQLQQQASILIGEEINEEVGAEVYDAFEISAHARSAPDHEPVQGRVLLKTEFEKMQAGEDFIDVDGRMYQGFRRPIGEWNCMHIAMSFSTQHSVRRYTDKQLDDWKAANAKGCEIDGKHYTTYQAVQLMRQIETAVRRQKDAAVAAKAAGDTELRQECQKRINALAAKYYSVANTAGITPRQDRMTVEGFRAIKVH